MEQEGRRKNSIVLLGYIGIVGIIITIVSDIILLSKPDAGITFFINGTKTMEDLASWRIYAGTFLGVMALPVSVLGLVPIYNALKPSGRLLSGTVFATGAHALLMGAAFHMSFVYMGNAWKLAYDNSQDKVTVLKLMQGYEACYYALIVIMLIDILICSIAFIYAILKGKTVFPRWVAACNPIVIVLVVFGMISCIPDPVGGIISPTALNLSTLIIVVITTKLYSKKS